MIPKMIHIIWIGPKPFPYQENYDSWVNLNPEFKVKLWTDMNIPTLHNKKAFGYMKSYAAKADILRLELLYRYGGIYADADSRCLRSIYPLISGLRCFGMTGNRGNVANGFLGSVKKHPAFEKLVYGLEGHIKKLAGKKQKKWSIYSVAGTRYITRVLRADNTFVQIDKGARLGSRKYVCARREVNNDTYVVQYCDGGKHPKIDLGRYKV